MASRTGKESHKVRQRTTNLELEDQSSVIYDSPAESKGQRKDRSKVNPLIIPFLYPVCIFFILYQIILYIDGRLPQGVTISDAVSHKGSPVFSAERAMDHLSLLSDIGPKVTGSHENEVLTVDFLLREINWATVSLAAREKDRISISKQQAMGWYYLAFKPNGMMNTYEGIQNIVVKLASKRPSTTSLMINCHYDTVPTSPECSGGLILREGKCKSLCPRQRFYANSACLPCHYSCKSCSGPNDYECTECFEDATPLLFHTINQTSASSFRCISSDVFQALLSEHWYFWFFIAILCATALISFVIVLLCYQRCSAGHHPQVEGHIYHKLGTKELHTNEKRREPIVGESTV